MGRLNGHIWNGRETLVVLVDYDPCDCIMGHCGRIQVLFSPEFWIPFYQLGCRTPEANFPHRRGFLLPSNMKKGLFYPFQKLILIGQFFSHDTQVLFFLVDLFKGFQKIHGQIDHPWSNGPSDCGQTDHPWSNGPSAVVKTTTDQKCAGITKKLTDA